MSINQSGWRPEAPQTGNADAPTFTGNRALMLDEPLIFEIGSTATTGVDFDEARVPAKAGIQSGLPPLRQPRLDGLEPTATIALPGLSVPEPARHYTRLTRHNYAIQLGLFPPRPGKTKHNTTLQPKNA